jgi:hypothetical protein
MLTSSRLVPARVRLFGEALGEFLPMRSADEFDPEA